MVAESQSQAVFPKRDKTRLAEGHALKAARKLNYREKRFCALIVQGLSARKAYMAVSGLTNEDSASSLAYRWSVRPAVAAQIAKLRAELTEEGALSRAEKRHTLANITRDDGAVHRDKLTAIAIDNRMTGDDDPFRKAAGEDAMRVSFFVVRVGEELGSGAENANALAQGSQVPAIELPAIECETTQAQATSVPALPSPQASSVLPT